jgi:hypothetical protein
MKKGSGERKVFGYPEKPVRDRIRRRMFVPISNIV